MFGSFPSDIPPSDRISRTWIWSGRSGGVVAEVVFGGGLWRVKNFWTHFFFADFGGHTMRWVHLILFLMGRIRFRSGWMLFFRIFKQTWYEGEKIRRKKKMFNGRAVRRSKYRLILNEQVFFSKRNGKRERTADCWQKFFRLTLLEGWAFRIPSPDGAGWCSSREECRVPWPSCRRRRTAPEPPGRRERRYLLELNWEKFNLMLKTNEKLKNSKVLF